jgi:excisionase family DNA binding protein
VSADRLPPYTVTEAAARLGINRRTAYKLIEDGEFPVPTFRIGTLVKVPRRPLDALVETGSAVTR